MWSPQWRVDIAMATTRFRRRFDKTFQDLDGVSFHRQVTNLVAIDNVMIGSRQPNDSNQTNQVDPQVLKKALEQCTEGIKSSEKRIEDLNSRSATMQQLSYQVLGFFLVFQAAILALAFNQTTVFESKALDGITDLSLHVTLIGFFAILGNSVSTFGLEWRSWREQDRLKIYKGYKRKLLLHGVAFEFDEDQEITAGLTSFELIVSQSFIIHIIILMAMLYLFFISGKTVRTIVSARQSPVASAAPAPAPSAPVQSGTSPGKTWCVAKAGSPDIDLMNGLSFACGEGGVDCGPIQAGGACFSPDTIVSHASFAYNSYYQNMGRNPSYCYFGGTSIITITTPSYLGCSLL